MKLELSDLKYIYLDIYHPFAERIDYAWSVYINKDIKEEYREQALKFLIYAFDINIQHFNKADILNLELSLLMDESIKDNIEQEIANLIQEREQYKLTHPEYIPRHTPERIRQLILTQQAHSKEVIQDHLKDELLFVNEYGKNKDVQLKARYFTQEERMKHRVHIHNGLFYNHGELFSTKKSQAHNKKEFAGFTFNIHGEISVFPHLNMQDRIAHSSMNAGEPLICAGELQIQTGKLIAITTHSGHYQPSLHSMYTFLEYLESRGVDTSRVSILTFEDPSINYPLSPKKNKIHPNFYEVSAKTVYTNYKKMLDECLDDIHNTIISIYQQRDQKILPTWLTPLKELLRSPKDPKLVEQRRRFEAQLSHSLNWIRHELKENRIELNLAYDLLEYLIDKTQLAQKELYTSKKDTKASSNISSALTQLKASVEAIKQEESQENLKKESFRKIR